MLVTLRITSVDMNGFCGRDHHPVPAMIGELVTLIGCAPVYSPAEVDEFRAEFTEADADAAARLMLYTCRRADGSLVELVDFEVEVLSAAAPTLRGFVRGGGADEEARS
jgi:hypothetical protein